MWQELTMNKRKCFFLSLARLTNIQLWNIFMVYADVWYPRQTSLVQVIIKKIVYSKY